MTQAETTLLQAVRQAVREELAQVLGAGERLAPLPWPDRFRTVEAVLYVRQVHRRPKFAGRTLYRWLEDERLTDLRRPRRWLREEIDACLAGEPVSRETRGRRRA